MSTSPFSSSLASTAVIVSVIRFPPRVIEDAHVTSFPLTVPPRGASPASRLTAPASFSPSCWKTMRKVRTPPGEFTEVVEDHR